MLQKGVMDDTATACDDSDPVAIGPCLWTAKTLPRAVASRTRVGFAALGPNLRHLAYGTSAHLPGLPSSYAPGTLTREALLRGQGSPSEQRASVTRRRAATRWSRS